MNKGRVEAFSDGVFSIVMTLLIFDIKVPDLIQPVADSTLWQAIGNLYPLIIVYFLSFAVLSTLWINHHFLFHSFAKAVDRRLNLLNLTYLAFVAFVPFSAQLLGSYHESQPAAIVYGVNLLCVTLVSMGMMRYITRHADINNELLADRVRNQARFRGRISLYCYLLGILSTFLYPPIIMLFFIFPILFNIIPGTLDLTERIFRLKLD